MKERIRQRVSKGGHGIPDEYVERRYDESIKNLRNILEQCEKITFYDNTNYFDRIAYYQNGKYDIMTEVTPQWLTLIIGDETKNDING